MKKESSSSGTCLILPGKQQYSRFMGTNLGVALQAGSEVGALMIPPLISHSTLSQGTIYKPMYGYINQ